MDLEERKEQHEEDLQCQDKEEGHHSEEEGAGQREKNQPEQQGFEDPYREGDV